MTAVLALAMVALPFVITPGASFTLTVAHAHPAAHTPTHQGNSPAWRRIAVGTSAGMLVIAGLVGATGLATFVTSTPTLRMGLGLAGAAVLIAYGTMICVRGFRAGRGETDSAATTSGHLVRWSFLIVLTNPKALALYVLIVPTLARPGLDGFSLLMAFVGIHSCMQAAWLCLIHNVVVRIPALARSDRIRRHLLAASGILMLCLGAFAVAHSLAAID